MPFDSILQYVLLNFSIEPFQNLNRFPKSSRKNFNFVCNSGLAPAAHDLVAADSSCHHHQNIDSTFIIRITIFRFINLSNFRTEIQIILFQHISEFVIQFLIELFLQQVMLQLSTFSATRQPQRTIFPTSSKLSLIFLELEAQRRKQLMHY